MYTKISCISNDKNIFCDLARYFSQVYKIKFPKNLLFLFSPSIFGPFHSGRVSQTEEEKLIGRRGIFKVYVPNSFILRIMRRKLRMLNEVLQTVAKLDQQFKSTQIRYKFVFVLFFSLPLYHMPSQSKSLYNQSRDNL